MSGRRSVLSRLRGRSWAEWRFRGTQAAVAVLERVGVGDLAEPSAAGLASLLGPDARRNGLAAWCHAFRSRGGRGFFAGFDDAAATTAQARAVDPAGTAAVLRTAERALAGRFDLLGFTDLSYGEPPDWHLDPVAGVRAPRAHWSRVAFLDPAVAGDHKVTWELNRHQWLVSLGQAWRLTGEARFAAGVAEGLTGWMDANPPKVGMNWASSLEVAFRAISWCWALRLAADAPALPDAVVLRAVGHLRLAARHLERNLSTYFSPNTHLTGEALALYYLGHELRDLAGATRWRTTGRDVLLAWLPTHVRPDGTYFEQSTWYHRYTLDFYLHFALLAERTGDALPATVRDAIRRLGEVVAHTARPDGTIPLIGDDDGGRLLFLDGRTMHDARPALANAGLATGNGFLCARGTATTESLWLLGADAAGRAGRLAAGAALPSPSRHFPDGGLAVLRSGWDAGASVCTVDAGPHGAMNCGHAHADALALDLALAGTPLFVDPGTMVYTRDPALRNRFRATASHSAATVDGADSSVMTGAFTWNRKAAARVDAWVPAPRGDYLAATHDGFPGTYRREVLRLDTPGGGTWIVRDTFDATAPGTLAAHWQCAPGLDVTVRDGRATVTRAGAPVATVVAATGTLSSDTGEVSPTYGVSSPAPRLHVAASGSGRRDVCTVIGAAIDAVEAAADGGALTVAVTTHGRRWVATFGASRLPLLGWELDGRVAWGEQSPGQAPAWWRALDARGLRVDGHALLDETEPCTAGSPDGANTNPT